MNLFKFKANEQGSFTVEASLVLPIIFIITIVFLFFSIFVYQKVTLYILADETARRAALIWDNSYKNPATGEFNPVAQNGSGYQDQNNGLYWRLQDYQIMDLLFLKFSSYSSPVEIDIEGSFNGMSSNSNLTKRKLENASAFLPAGVKGTISYNNLFYKREIVVELKSPIKMPEFSARMLGLQDENGEFFVNARASTYVSEPVEFIRNVDFAIYGASKISQMVSGRNPKSIVEQFSQN